MILLILLGSLWTEHGTSPCLDQANALLKHTVLIDGHVDLPERLIDHPVDISKATSEGHFDIPRAQQGGLSAPFMSIYVAAKYQKEGDPKAVANALIDLVENLVNKNPSQLALAYSPDEVEANFKKGLISLPMGLENGAPLGQNLDNVDYFFKRGIRYITLTHSKDNQICDSSFDESRTWKGLSTFGIDVIKRMNKIGIMVDVSHITDDTFFQVMKISQAPVIASHSSCRNFLPGFERNMSDEMIQLLAEKGGVIQINFGSSFLTAENNSAGVARWKAMREFMAAQKLNYGDPKLTAYRQEYVKEHPTPKVMLQSVVDHIDHVVKLVGIDHVGIGSDFDGVDELPVGLEDVSHYPELIAALMCKGYTSEDITKICSGNVFRVWREVEEVAHRLQTKG